jgi:hypothetical protein
VVFAWWVLHNGSGPLSRAAGDNRDHHFSLYVDFHIHVDFSRFSE